MVPRKYAKKFNLMFFSFDRRLEKIITGTGCSMFFPELQYMKNLNLKKNDLFLFPSLSKSYQESIFNLNISEEKLLDGEKNKHFISENLLSTDHPTVIKNNPSRSVENIPHWIIKWL